MVFDYTLPPKHPWANHWVEDVLGRQFNMEFSGVDTVRPVTVIGVGKLPLDMGGGMVLRLEAQ